MKNIRKLFVYFNPPKILRIMVAILLLIIISGGFLYYQKTRDRVFIDNSLVSAQIIPIASIAPARLNKLYVYEGEIIRQGTPIADVGDQIIRAESDALVVKAQNIIGSIISLQNPVVSLIKLSDLRIDGNLDENKGLNKIKVGQAVSFTIDAFAGKTYWGFVDEISPIAKQTQVAFSISNERPTQQFEVFAKFDSAKYPEIRGGMSAKMTVFTNQP